MPQQEERELTQPEIDQQDKVQNACHKLVCDLVDDTLEWDMEWIGDLADLVTDIVCNRLKLAKEEAFYPYMEK
jgi:hypothetical protein